MVGLTTGSRHTLNCLNRENMKECKTHNWFVRKWYEWVENVNGKQTTIKIAREVACYNCNQWKDVNTHY